MRQRRMTVRDSVGYAYGRVCFAFRIRLISKREPSRCARWRWDVFRKQIHIPIPAMRVAYSHFRAQKKPSPDGEGFDDAVETRGLEPLTPAVQTRCSTN